MAHEPPTSLLPLREANPETKSAYLKGLQRRELDGNPEAWHCIRCGTTIPGDDILISHEMPTPIPYCPGTNCTAYGPELKPAES